MLAYTNFPLYIVSGAYFEEELNDYRLHDADTHSEAHDEKR